LNFLASSRADRRAHVTALDKARETFATKHTDAIRRVLTAQIETIATEIRQSGTYHLESRALYQVLNVIYLDVAGHFGAIAAEQGSENTGEDLTYNERETNDYISRYLADRVHGTDRNTRRIIDGIREDVILGKSDENFIIAQEVLDWWEANEGNRTEGMAWNEVVNASNLGVNSGISQSEREKFKIWVTTLDGNQRETHEDANDQTVPIDDSFTVGGSRLRWPGDLSEGADLKEVYGCRCALAYELRD